MAQSDVGSLPGGLPIEIWTFILNGHVRKSRSSCDVYDALLHNLHDKDDKRAHRGYSCCDNTDTHREYLPLLDPRWRFAARATCRLWRHIIQHPSPTDAAFIESIRPFRSTASPLDEPKRVLWLSGRGVYASAAGHIIANHAHIWANTPEAAVAWCQQYGNATPKQAAVALVASDVGWALDYLVQQLWPRFTFSALECDLWRGKEDALSRQTARPDRTIAFLGNYLEHLDGQGHPAVAETILLLIALRHGSHGAYREIQRAFSRMIEPLSAALHAVQACRPDVFAMWLAENDVLASADKIWYTTAASDDPRCFEHLLKAGHAPPPARMDALIPFWLCSAILRDRHQTVALLDKHDVGFDRAYAFTMAARHASVKTMGYLAPTVAHGMNHEALHAIALQAASGPEDRVYDTDWPCAIAYLADVIGYAPRPGTDDMRQLVECACSRQHATRRLLYLVERWASMFVDLPVESIRAAFLSCAMGTPYDPSLMASRLAAVLDRLTPRARAPAAIDTLDLWGSITAYLKNDYCGPTSSGALFICALCALSLGRTPPPFDTMPGFNLYQRIRNGTAPRGVDLDAPRGDLSSCQKTLRRWCVPRPVRADTLFPDQAAPPFVASDIASAYKTHVLQGLESCGLLLADPLPCPSTV